MLISSAFVLPSEYIQVENCHIPAACRSGKLGRSRVQTIGIPLYSISLKLFSSPVSIVYE